MKKNGIAFRVIAVALLVALSNLLILPGSALAQSGDCAYDKNKPSLESARISFKSLNYQCAENEIQDFLMLDNVSIEDKASAHVLLAAVYYAMVKNHNEKRDRVLNQFKEAFRSYREWAGELDISSTEFIDLMKKAQELVDEEAEEPEAAVVPAEEEAAPEPAVVQPTTATAAEGGGKAWYKQWWAIGLGVGVVVGAAVLLAGGGDDETKTPDAPIDDFPPPPPSKK
ncbi:MAG: hypothetical protein JXA92_03515 [candidate division Zixibacteria bacterium]|nr:hypothetical protein [candidate division Zixibacteria bacterium]